MECTLNVNGKSQRISVRPDETRLEALRYRLDFIGTKEGCGEGDCGACTIQVDGRAVEIQRLSGRGLRPAVDLEKLGERTLMIDCDLILLDEPGAGEARGLPASGAFQCPVGGGIPCRRLHPEWRADAVSHRQRSGVRRSARQAAAAARGLTRAHFGTGTARRRRRSRQTISRPPATISSAPGKRSSIGASSKNSQPSPKASGMPK